jgi:hypothetical protein
MREMINAFNILVGKRAKRQHWRHKHRWIRNKNRVGRNWIGFSWFQIGRISGSCEHDNTPSGFTKGKGFLIS